MFSRHIHGTLHPRNAAWQAEEDQCEAVVSVGWEIQEREDRDREVLQANLKAAQVTVLGYQTEQGASVYGLPVPRSPPGFLAGQFQWNFFAPELVSNQTIILKRGILCRTGEGAIIYYLGYRQWESLHGLWLNSADVALKLGAPCSVRTMGKN